MSRADTTGPEQASRPTTGRRTEHVSPGRARAALDLFSRQGFDETTVDEIAAAVGCPGVPFFRYFESKADCGVG